MSADKPCNLLIAGVCVSRNRTKTRNLAPDAKRTSCYHVKLPVTYVSAVMFFYVLRTNLLYLFTVNLVEHLWGSSFYHVCLAAVTIYSFTSLFSFSLLFFE